MDKTRVLAVKLLIRCEEQGYSNLVLKAALEKETLDVRDKQFVRALVYGTLEKQRLLDALLDLFLKKPCKKLDASVRAILRSGLYQCRYMESVPVYAAVNASVELARNFKKTSAGGMVNAVLRKAAEVDVKQLHFTDEIERLGVFYNVSDSIAAMFCREYGEEAERILAAFEQPAPVILRVNTLLTTAEKLMEQLRQEGISVQQGPLKDSVVLPQGGNLAATKAFEQGWFHVQGVGSQLAALTMEAKPEETILDLCAAPGGKSVTMAQQMRNRGKLICGEYQKNRVSLLEKQLQRCGVSIAQVRCADASAWDETMPTADGVLCDVPCSGTGTLSKKPDIRYKDLEKSRDELTETQLKILRTAARYVRAGGRIVYSTCSLDPAENEGITERFLQENPEFRNEPVLPESIPYLQRSVGTVILPAAGANDGFYIAKLRKV